MERKTEKLINFLKKNGGIVRFSAILKAGFHPDSLNTLVRERKIQKISTGLYRLPGYDTGEYPDFVTACLQAPRGVICLLSALSFHEATIEIPKYVDIALPRGSHTYRIKYPPVRFYRFDRNSWKSGIEEHTTGEHKIKIYTLAKTVADCFKFRNRIGINVARDALKISIAEKNIKPAEIIKYARICRVENIIKPILEAVL